MAVPERRDAEVAEERCGQEHARHDQPGGDQDAPHGLGMEGGACVTLGLPIICPWWWGGGGTGGDLTMVNWKRGLVKVPLLRRRRTVEKFW